MDAPTLTKLAANAWATHHGIAALSYERPDVIDRRHPAVDLLGRDEDGRTRLVLEHTLVESFLDQRSAQIAAIRMFKPLERVLSGRLPSPGHYNLAVRAIRVLGLKRELTRIRAWVEQWVRDTAPTLAIGSSETAPRHFATVDVPNTALEVTLSRWPHWDGRFELGFDAPPESEGVLTPSLARALSAKCPKLAAAKNDSVGVESLLLLEIHDIALGNLFDLDAVLQPSLKSVETVPDHIWLVDTTDQPPSVMISKDGTRIGEAVADRFLPFHLRVEDAANA